MSRRGGVKSACCSTQLQLAIRDASSCSDNDYNDYKYGGYKRTCPFPRTPLISLGCFSVLYWKFNNNISLTDVTSRLKVNALFGIKTAQCDEGARSKRFNFIAEAVEMAAPAVVCIEINQTVNTIFGRIAHPSSAGSGFIISREGHVLTNAHVVHGSTDVTVKLSNKRYVKGEVVATDQHTDLALIKLHLDRGEEVPFIPLGSSRELRLGEWVIALGSPLNLSNSVTAGIVSCVHRASEEIGLDRKPDMEYIQTDAMITRGNSGGPLVNLDGEVIGINTMTAGSGISFAIPVDRAKEFIQATKRTKKKSKKKQYGIGVSLLTATPDIIYQLQLRTRLPLDITSGVILAEIWRGSPADYAGLKKGDFVVKVNGNEMTSSRELHRIVQKGQTMEMEIIRDGRIRKMVVVNPVTL